MTSEKGKLVRWVDDKGFGFIKPENGKDDIFIHISALTSMSRKPVIGDVIQYQIGFDINGKTRAVNAEIEGVSPIPAKEKTYRKPRKNGNPNRKLKLLPVLIVIGIAVFVYSKVLQIKTPLFEPPQRQQTEQFQCRGKVWCSEMTTYEEALFYLRNCPGTKMDGDNDGIPCEQQF